jgi:hypothetical protein
MKNSPKLLVKWREYFYDAVILFAVAFLLGGVAMVFGGVSSAMRYFDIQKDAVLAIATVTEVERFVGQSGIHYTLHITFTTESGETITGKLTRAAEWEIGETIGIEYKASEPHTFEAHEDTLTLVSLFAFGFFALIFLTAGITACYIVFKKKTAQRQFLDNSQKIWADIIGIEERKAFFSNFHFHPFSDFQHMVKVNLQSGDRLFIREGYVSGRELRNLRSQSKAAVYIDWNDSLNFHVSLELYQSDVGTLQC